MNADYIIYFDADTIISPGFLNKILPILDKNKFIIADPTCEEDLTGFLIIHKDIFITSGGFEESFRSWGAEDLEFRLRLFVKHNYKFNIITCECLSSIHHGNNLRVQFYGDKDIEISNRRNLFRLKQMYKSYTGKTLQFFKLNADKDPDLFKLLSMHPRIKNDLANMG